MNSPPKPRLSTTETALLLNLCQDKHDVRYLGLTLASLQPFCKWKACGWGAHYTSRGQTRPGGLALKTMWFCETLLSDQNLFGRDGSLSQ